MEVLNNNINNDYVFFVTKSVPDDPSFFSFDFFIFKPKLLKKNIFIEELNSYEDTPEHYLSEMIKKNNVNYLFINRFNNNSWYPRRIDDNLKLWHEHDLQEIEKYNILKGI